MSDRSSISPIISSRAQRKTEALYRDLKLAVEYVPIDQLKAYRRALRMHSTAHIEQLKASMQTFGIVQAVMVDAAGEIIGGQGIFEAAVKAGYTAVPVVRLSHLDEAQKRTLRIALNKLQEASGWNKQLLAVEFKELLEIEVSLDLDFDLAITGFHAPEIDQLVASIGSDKSDEADEVVPEAELGQPAISRLGDLWLMDGHRLICGDARAPATYAALFGEERAAMGIHDAPYDVPMAHVATRQRREFVMGAGELGANFTPFLTDFLKASSAFLVPGAYQFCFMDWRHMRQMLDAGEAAGLELKNLCVWNKGAGAMGSLYRSQHELIFVFKDPHGPGTNCVQLGKFGRNRTNVWDYPGAASLRKELELHPTPKHVMMIADAIRDVTDRNAIVLDAFSGSGTTIIACARIGRRGYAVELDPHYVDVGVRRWERWSGKSARHAGTGLSFAEMAQQRQAAPVERIARTAPATDDVPGVRIRQRAAQVA